MSDNISTRPSLADLTRELEDVEAQWGPLGVQLGVPVEQLRSIHANSAFLGQTLCMKEMLSFWLDHKHEASWGHIVAAFKKLQNVTLANSLAIKYRVRMQNVSQPAGASCAAVDEPNEASNIVRAAAIVQQTDEPTAEIQRSHSMRSFYTMNKEAAHGTALIINNIKWLPDGNGKPLMPTRDGAKQDGEALKEALEKIRYQVIYRENYVKDKMIQKLKDLRGENIRPEDDSFICCLLSHGGKDGVYGVDKQCVSIDELSKILEPSDKFRKLNHKPKIFFVQACRGTDVMLDTAYVQAPKPLSVPCGADFFVSYATGPNHVALRHPYPQFLSEELVVPDMSLDDIVMEVHKKLAGELPIVVEDKRHLQIGQVVQTMRGKFYFQ